LIALVLSGELVPSLDLPFHEPRHFAVHPTTHIVW
jgi:hypothetical protein